MKSLKVIIKDIRVFGILWLTQSFSSLGSAMTNFALILWSYQEHESAFTTALLSVCSYAPYVVMSIFAGTLSDKWNKKAIMLVCDSAAAVSTVIIWILLQTNELEIWHLYCLNALNGLMNTIQQPAADVAITLITPKKYYQMASGMRSFSNSLVSILAPVIAGAILSLVGIEAVIAFDLLTFTIAFFFLLFFVKIPKIEEKAEVKYSVIQSAIEGLDYLKKNRGILDLIFFLAAINFIASIYEAALPAMLLSREGGGEMALGIVNAITGVSMLIGSLFASMLPAPKSRVRVICNSLLISMSTENLFLAFGRSVSVWCLGAVLGWIAIPVMNANMDVLFRTYIPVSIQGRVYSARNTLQFFTIPAGYLLGGALVDKVFEPFMALQPPQGLFAALFGTGKGSGAALLFFVIALPGIWICMVFRKDVHIWKLEEEKKN